MSTWFAERVLDLVGALAEIYYTRKYGALARRLGRPSVSLEQRQGFIVLQIDGLSYDSLIQAVAAGHMPYLGRLLAERRLVVTPWRCGLPSTTPAVQAGIMFGNRFDIPGFRWYEKERGQGMESKLPDSVGTMRTRVSRGRRGILRGGSCYVSMFDGDADLALFTLSTFHRQHFFENARGMGFFLLFLLSPFRVVRVAWLVGRNYLSGVARRLVALMRPSVVNPFDVFSPFLKALSETLFTEVQTFGVMLDIYRRAPSIYANYTTYDDVIHKAGLNHRDAFRALRDVDKRIHQIDRMRARYRMREYDLYILSDHGNTPSIPFSWRNGVSFQQHVVAQIGAELPADERVGAHVHSVNKVRYLIGELESLERRAPRTQRILAAIRRYVGRRVADDQNLDYDLGRQRDVVVSASGPLAHLYFNITPRPLDLFEVVFLYPRLLGALLMTPGVGVLAGRAGERTLVVGSQGGTLIIGDGEETVEGAHPLAAFGDATYAAAQLHTLLHFPHAGDLVVLGAVEPDGSVVAFEEQVATHGGLGGPQMRPFIACSPECSLTPEALGDAVDLYPYFVQRYLEQEQPSSEEVGIPVESVHEAEGGVVRDAIRNIAA